MLTNKNDIKKLGFAPADGYTLADLTQRQVIEGIPATYDELLEVDERIMQSMRYYEGDTYEELNSIRAKHVKIENFIKALRQDMLAGNIKCHEADRYSDVSPKRASLRAAIIRAGKKSGYAVSRTLEEAEFGEYEIPHRFGWTFSTALNHIATEDGFKMLLLNNLKINTIAKIRILSMAQINHRKRNDAHFVKYQEIRDFQKTSHFTISTDIANGDDISKEKLEQVYEAYQQFKVKYDEVKAMAEMFERKFE